MITVDKFSPSIKLVECPRDAMQGIKTFIPTQTKIKYLNTLLQVGFDTLDFGSFVSPKAIPQMRDTAEVLAGLDLSTSDTKLLAIVANRRGAISACSFSEISYLGFPFSVSPTFQQRNTNASLEEAIERVKDIQHLCISHQKKLVVYLSMGFGNPYGDPWNVGIVQEWVDVLADLGIRIIALSDTIGVSNPASIEYLFGNLIPPYPDVEFGAHLHTLPSAWEEKIAAAYAAGCRRFDGALRGFGGCPMAKDDLTGNMPTERMISYLKKQGMKQHLDDEALQLALQMTATIF